MNSFSKIIIFYLKNIYFRYTFLLWGITHGEIIENMLRLMRLGVHFKRILKIKWLFSYRNNYGIVTRICFRGSGAYVTRENFENMMQFGAFWFIFDQIVSNSLKK